MTVPSKPPEARAIFLSYAREDADVARRIAETLRATGIEVWFDQNELRSGDAWDQKIRNQIHTCTLLVPVVSANTQLRGEGYFRREWRLAVERTHDMALGIPFLVPVVIDATPESAAVVPEEFLRVQWTRLPRGEVPPEFIARIKQLLEAPRGAVDDGSRGLTVPSHLVPSLPAPIEVTRRKVRRTPTVAWVAVFALLACAGGLLIQFTRSTPTHGTDAASLPSPAHPALAEKPTPPNESRALTEKARALQDEFAMDDALRDNLTLAEQLCKKAVELDPMNAEAWAISARVNLSLMNFDTNRSRLDAARTEAQRAMQLAPQSVEVRLAMADYYRKQGGSMWPEAERILRELVQQEPADKRVLRGLALVLLAMSRPAEALVYYDRAAALPGGDSKALINRANILFNMERFAEAEASVNQSLALRQTVSALVLKMSFLMWRGDLDGARDTLGKVPATARFEDKCAYFASVLWLWRREPEQCLAVLRDVPRDFFNDALTLRGPKGFLAAQAHRLAGRADAAQAELQAALHVVEQRRGAQPNEPTLLAWRALLLASAGDRVESEQAFRLYEQLGGSQPTLVPMSAGVAYQPDFMSAEILLLLGRRDEAINKVQTFLQRARSPSYRATIKFDPIFDPLRDDPRFVALLKEPAAPAAR